MINRAWKIGDFVTVSDSEDATIYQIEEFDEYTVRLTYHSLLMGTKFQGGWVNKIDLRRPTHDQFAKTLRDHINEFSR